MRLRKLNSAIEFNIKKLIRGDNPGSIIIFVTVILPLKLHVFK